MPTEQEREEYGQMLWDETSQSTRDNLSEALKPASEKLVDELKHVTKIGDEDQVYCLPPDFGGTVPRLPGIPAKLTSHTAEEWHKGEGWVSKETVVKEEAQNNFDKDIEDFCKKWKTSKEAVLELLAAVGGQNGIRAVSAELPA